jgi:hypothetical protein
MVHDRWESPTNPSLDRQAPSRLGDQRGEDGAMTVFMIATALLLLLLFGLVFNEGLAVLRKIDLQNRADSIALAMGRNQASALNQLLSANHLIGEELAWAVIPEALSGSNVTGSDLESGDRREAERLAKRIPDLTGALQRLGQSTPAAGTLQQPIASGATTGQAKIRLRGALVRNYEQRLGGTTAALLVQESAILAEWQVLSQLEARARLCGSAKAYLLSQSIPALLDQTYQLVQGRGPAATREAHELGAAQDVEGGLWPSAPPLPVWPEAVDLADPDPVHAFRDAQIVQASWPWVLYDRQPVAERLKSLTYSSATELYDRWIVTMTARLARRIYLQTQQSLFVLTDSTPARKGVEPLLFDSRLADRRFGLLTLAYRPAPEPLAATIFRKSNPAGQLAHCQVLLFNALPQRPSVEAPTLQTQVGWDTLNWSVPVARYPAIEPVVLPRVNPGWRARLVPVTLLDVAAPDLEMPFRGPVDRIVPVPRALQTH